MPVADHPIHASTIKTNRHPGCYNRADFAEGRQALDRDVHTLESKRVWVPNVMTRECHQRALAECEGCKRRIEDDTRATN